VVLTRWLAEPHGLLLVTGPTGAGKSTTAASMLDHVNHTAARHVVTLEDPIEFHFEEEQAIINQREIGADTRSFSEGLRNVLQQSPDLLFVSDIRDAETMEVCLVAAESGQLVLSCIHTTNAVTTVERLVAYAPLHQHQLLRLRLSLILRGILSLRLLPRLDGAGRVPVCEVLVATPAVRELIREGRTERLPSAIHDGAMYGMQTLTQALYHRYRQGDIDLAEALRVADRPEELQLAVRDIHSIGDVQS
jgi:twitching motility protein PilT